MKSKIFAALFVVLAMCFAAFMWSAGHDWFVMKNGHWYFNWCTGNKIGLATVGIVGGYATLRVCMWLGGFK